MSKSNENYSWRWYCFFIVQKKVDEERNKKKQQQKLQFDFVLQNKTIEIKMERIQCERVVSTIKDKFLFACVCNM